MRNARIWRERPDTFRGILESRFNRKWTHHEETRIVTLDGRAIDVLFTIARSLSRRHPNCLSLRGVCHDERGA